MLACLLSALLAVQPGVTGESDAAASAVPGEGAEAPLAPPSGPAAGQPAQPVPAPPEAAAPAYPAPPPEVEAVSLLAAAMDRGASPDARAAALGALGQLEDDRLISPLLYLAQDKEAKVRLAAVSALAALGTAASEQALDAAVRDSSLQTDARLGALRGLAGQGLATTPERLLRLHEDRRLPSELTSAAKGELETRYPGLLPPPAPPAAVALREKPESSGQGLLAASGAIFGGYTLYGVGVLGESEVGPVIGALGGAALGGTAGLVLGTGWGLSRAMATSTATGLGLWAGYGLGYGVAGLGSDDARIHLFTIGGEILGATAATLGWRLIEPAIQIPAAERGGGEGSLSLGTAALGGVALHLLSQARPSDPLEVWGAASGIALGGAAGSLFGRRLTPPQGAWMTTGIGWGLFTGMLTGIAALPKDATGAQVESVALAGGVLGFGAAALSYSPQMAGGDVGLANLIAASSLSMGLGTILIPEPKDDVRPAMAVLAGASALGLTAGRVLAPRMSLREGDAGLVGLGAAHGFFGGLAVPSLFESNQDSHPMAGGMLGLGLGTLGGAALAQAFDPTADQVTVLFLSDAFASLAGLGGGLLAGANADGRSSLPAAGYLAGGALGLGGASLLGRELVLSPGDIFTVSLASLWGAWQGVGLAIGLDANDDQSAGATLLGLGAGGLAAVAAASRLELTPGTLLAASSGTIWGAWLATSAVLLKKENVASDLLIVLGASDVGLGLTALALNAGATPKQIGIADLGGLGGAVVATLATALGTRESQPLLIANLVGTGVGLGVGALVARGFGSEETEPSPEPRASVSGGGPALTFLGLTTQPVIERDGRLGGMSLGVQFAGP